MQVDPEKQREAVKEELRRYSKMSRVKDSEEIQELFDLLLRTVAMQMMTAFATGKDGDNIKNWDDFCSVRGEIRARLQPIQEIYGSEYMVKHLTEQLKNSYARQT